MLWLPLVLGQDGLGLLKVTPPLPVLVSLGTVGPLIACFATHRLEAGDWRAVRLFPRTRGSLIWVALGPMLILLSLFFVFPALMSKGTPTPWQWRWSALVGILVPMFNYNLLGGPLFEESGWRGFLQTRLQRVLPPWFAAISVGVAWAIWHLPLFLVRGWTSASPLVFLLILIGLSLLMAFGFNASGQSVVVAILMHSAFNSSPRCLGQFLSGVAIREYPSGETLIAASVLSVGALAALLTRGRLAKAAH